VETATHARNDGKPVWLCDRLARYRRARSVCRMLTCSVGLERSRVRPTSWACVSKLAAATLGHSASQHQELEL
jgi:hypothetical protein